MGSFLLLVHCWVDDTHEEFFHVAAKEPVIVVLVWDMKSIGGVKELVADPWSRFCGRFQLGKLVSETLDSANLAVDVQRIFCTLES